MAIRSYTAIVEKEGPGYVALCPELDVTSQGETVESATDNLKEAVELFLECADPGEVERRLHTQICVTRFEAAHGQAPGALWARSLPDFWSIRLSDGPTARESYGHAAADRARHSNGSCSQSSRTENRDAPVDHPAERRHAQRLRRLNDKSEQFDRSRERDDEVATHRALLIKDLSFALPYYIVRNNYHSKGEGCPRRH